MSIWLVIMAIGFKAVDSSLISFIVMLTVAAGVAYLPLVKRSLGYEDDE